MTAVQAKEREISAVEEFNLIAPVFIGNQHDEDRQKTFQAFKALYHILEDVSTIHDAFNHANIKQVTDTIGEDAIKRFEQYLSGNEYRWTQHCNN